MTLDLHPQALAAPRGRRAAAHARLELLMMLRNGEQLLLTAVIPVGLLLFLSLTQVVEVGGTTTEERLEVVVPSMFALALLSTAFTSLAIQTGFERRYGVLRRVATTPLTRLDVLSGKAAAIAVIETVQVVVLASVGLALGWSPDPVGLVLAVPLLVIGSASLAALALLLAGVARAEATLALANLGYLLFAGVGVIVPLSTLPANAQRWAELLPATAVAESLRVATIEGRVAWEEVLVMVVWGALAAIGVVKWFRWE